jgi:hypothetical protein
MRFSSQNSDFRLRLLMRSPYLAVRTPFLPRFNAFGACGCCRKPAPNIYLCARPNPLSQTLESFLFILGEKLKQAQKLVNIFFKNFLPRGGRAIECKRPKFPFALPSFIEYRACVEQGFR